MTDTATDMIRNYEPDPTLARGIAKRMNDAFERIARDNLMQMTRPFAPIIVGSHVTIGILCPPRDAEILASVLERIERDESVKVDFTPTANDVQLPNAV